MYSMQEIWDWILCHVGQNWSSPLHRQQHWAWYCLRKVLPCLHHVNHWSWRFRHHQKYASQWRRTGTVICALCTYLFCEIKCFAIDFNPCILYLIVILITITDWKKSSLKLWNEAFYILSYLSWSRKQEKSLFISFLRWAFTNHNGRNRNNVL